ncbi:MAG: IS110 family transposase [Candidatus Accumulibacter sp.]|nr:IS110 family transposase [Accumulibacter sp.]
MEEYLGIDVGAKSVVVCVRRGGRSIRTQTFSQTPEGHRALIEHHAGRPAGVVLEATGVYYLDLAVTLFRAGWPVAVINPRSFHHFAKLKLSRSKTDGADAALLAEYGECMKPALWQAPNEDLMNLRDIGRQINRLTVTRTQAKNRLHALRAKSTTLALLIEDEIEGIERLDRRIERLASVARELILQHPDYQQLLNHMQQAKGIGEASAIALLAELAVLPRELKSAQVTRQAGLDVRLCQSGSSVSKPGRISKAGNAYLRGALYMPALSAVCHDPNAKAFYETLQKRGKKKIQALCAVMRKYLTGLWACIKLNVPFNSNLLFSPIHAKKP